MNTELNAYVTYLILFHIDTYEATENFNGPMERGNSIIDTSQAVKINLKQTVRASNAETHTHSLKICPHLYEGWNFNSGNYLFTTDTK